MKKRTVQKLLTGSVMKKNQTVSKVLVKWTFSAGNLSGFVKNSLICVSMNESLRGLEQHEGKLMITLS